MNTNTALLLGIAAGAVIGYLIAKYVATNQQTSDNTALVNEEHWMWKDYRGREREITVHREVSNA